MKSALHNYLNFDDTPVALSKTLLKLKKLKTAINERLARISEELNQIRSCVQDFEDK